MSAASLARVPAASAGEVCQQFELPEEAREFLRDGPAPRPFLDRLLGGKHHGAALEFLAHALPKREAVWWGCLCVRQAGGPKLPPAQEAALKAAVRWVLEPTDDNRAAAKAPAKAARTDTPAGCVALGAYWSGGSLNSPDLPAVPPHPLMTAQAVTGAVLLAAALSPPDQADQTRQQFADLGIGVGEGKYTWPEKKKRERKE